VKVAGLQGANKALQWQRQWDKEDKVEISLICSMENEKLRNKIKDLKGKIKTMKRAFKNS